VLSKYQIYSAALTRIFCSPGLVILRACERGSESCSSFSSPLLLAWSQNRDERRIAAEDALGNFGADANAAVPSLVELLKDEQPPRSFAAEALRRIDPGAAAKAGVK
jgi:hypothetical protein